MKKFWIRILEFIIIFASAFIIGLNSVNYFKKLETNADANNNSNIQELDDNNNNVDEHTTNTSDYDNNANLSTITHKENTYTNYKLDQIDN